MTVALFLMYSAVEMIINLYSKHLIRQQHHPQMPDQSFIATEDFNTQVNNSNGDWYIKKGQSMSRVGHRIDNGPAEGLWGTIKSEMYCMYKSLMRSPLDMQLKIISDFIARNVHRNDMDVKRPQELDGRHWNQHLIHWAEKLLLPLLIDWRGLRW